MLTQLWKARLSGYEELTRVFSRTASEDDPVFGEYARQTDTLRAMVLDSNAAAQEKGVEAVSAFVQYGGRRAGGTREHVLPAVAEKCLGSMRTGTKKAALDLVLLYAENEDQNGCEGISVRCFADPDGPLAAPLVQAAQGRGGKRCRAPRAGHVRLYTNAVRLEHHK